jgi:quinoprotein glucose dehydrogenase
VIGDRRASVAPERVIDLLKDPSARVRFFAALAIGRARFSKGAGAIVEMIRENGDKDPYLRHAGVTAVVGLDDPDLLAKAATDSSPSVRMAALLADRRLARPEIARFLDDPEPRLVIEAARAINDLPIDGALPALAALAARRDLSAPLGRRVIDANLQLRGAGNARNLGALAACDDLPESLRVEALSVLGDWANPSGRDHVTGLWHPLPARPSEDAAAALMPVLNKLLTGPSGRVRQAAIHSSGLLAMKEVAPLLRPLVSDVKNSPDARLEALQTLERLGDSSLPEAMRQAVSDPSPRLRSEGLRLLAKFRPDEAIPVLSRVLDQGSTSERQAACATLASLAGAHADQLLSTWLDRLTSGNVPAEIQLDLLEAAGWRESAEIKAKLAQYESSRPQSDPVAPYREALLGGNAARGRKIFSEKAAAECIRCHKIGHQGGEVGPDLTGIGKRQSRQYLLESIVVPNRQIAQGFETLVLALNDGQVVSGILKAEDANVLRLVTPEGKPLVIRKTDIEERKRGNSAMPEDRIKFLTKSEIRDLIEFLARSR